MPTRFITKDYEIAHFFTGTRPFAIMPIEGFYTKTRKYFDKN